MDTILIFCLFSFIFSFIFSFKNSGPAYFSIITVLWVLFFNGFILLACNPEPGLQHWPLPPEIKAPYPAGYWTRFSLNNNIPASRGNNEKIDNFTCVSAAWFNDKYHIAAAGTSEKGVMIYQNGQWSNYSYENTQGLLASDSIHDLDFDSSEKEHNRLTLYIACSSGLTKVIFSRYDDPEFYNITHTAGARLFNFTALSCDRQNIAFANDGCAGILNKVIFPFSMPDAFVKPARVLSLLLSNDQLIAGFEDGIALMQDGRPGLIKKQALISFDTSVKAFYVNALFRGNDFLMAGTDKGIFIKQQSSDNLLDKSFNTWYTFRPGSGLNKEWITSLWCSDRSKFRQLNSFLQGGEIEESNENIDYLDDKKEILKRIGKYKNKQHQLLNRLNRLRADFFLLRKKNARPENSILENNGLENNDLENTGPEYELKKLQFCELYEKVWANYRKFEKALKDLALLHSDKLFDKNSSGTTDILGEFFLWAGSKRSGLIQLRQNGFIRINEKNSSLQSSCIEDIFCSEEHSSAYIATADSGLYRYTLKAVNKEYFTVYKVCPQISHKLVIFGNYIYAASSTGLYRYDRTDFFNSQLVKEARLLSEPVRTLAGSSVTDTLWCASDNGLYVFNSFGKKDDIITSKHEDIRSKLNKISSLFPDNKGLIWAGIENLGNNRISENILRIEDKKVYSYSLLMLGSFFDDYLAKKGASHDKSIEMMHFSAIFKSLLLLDPKIKSSDDLIKSTIYDNTDKNKKNIPSSFAQCPDYLMTGTIDSGLQVFKNNCFIQITPNRGVDFDCIIDLKLDSGNKLFVLGKNNIVTFDGQNWRTILLPIECITGNMISMELDSEAKDSFIIGVNGRFQARKDSYTDRESPYYKGLILICHSEGEFEKIFFTEPLMDFKLDGPRLAVAAKDGLYAVWLRE
jgi:hypothetical protein